MKWYLFPKFFRQMNADELMAYCAREGIDGPTAMVRDGYWTPPDRLKDTIGSYVACAKKHGLEVKYADTPIDFKDPKASEEAYDILSSNGIEMIRLAYIERDDDRNPRALEDIGRRYAETAARYAEKYGVRSVIQLHGGFYPHNASAAWPLVKDLDPRFIGIKLDPGNNFAQEGYEHFGYQIRLLGEYIAAIGAKDGAPLRIGDPDVAKGWVRPFVPAYAGMADYKSIFPILKETGFTGPAVLMPFYHEDNPELLMKEFTKEIAYLKSAAKEIQA